MANVLRAGIGALTALLLPACNLTYIPDQSLPPAGSSGPPFGLFLPLDGATNIVTNPQFGWYALDGATSYRLQVSATSDFSEIVWDDSSLTVTTTIVTAVTLTNFTNFWWRVYGSVPGNPPLLAPGSPFQFRTDGGGSPSPGLFTTEFPTNGLAGVDTTPLFAWHPSPGADSYTIQVDAPSGDFSAPLFTQPNLHVNRGMLPVPLATGTEYRWRVQAIGQLGNAYSFDTPLFQTAP